MQYHSWWGLGMCNLTMYILERHLQGNVWWYGKMGWKEFFKPREKVTGMFIWENIQKVNSEPWSQVWGEKSWSGQGLLSSVVATEIKVSAWLSLACPCGCLQKGRRDTMPAGTWGQGNTTLVQGSEVWCQSGWTDCQKDSWALSCLFVLFQHTLLPATILRGVHIHAELSWGCCNFSSSLDMED